MARASYKCSLAGTDVEVLVERIILDDRQLGAKLAPLSCDFVLTLGKGIVLCGKSPRKTLTCPAETTLVLKTAST
jgi:hypothetical protein